MSGVQHYGVKEDDAGQRLGRWIKKNVPDLPYTLAQKLMRKGQIRVDGKRVKDETRLEAGQIVRIPPIERKPKSYDKPKLSEDDAALIRSLVIHDDGDVIALNKPSGLAVQGGTNTRRHIDGMLDALKGPDGVRPRLVHRLDKDTSGVLLLARSANVARKLGEGFKGRAIKKIYWALVDGVPDVREGSISAPLIKSGEDKERMIVDEVEGKKAVTEYKVLEYASRTAAFMAFWPRTGRTHQIRVHAEVIDCPVIGDWKYGRIERNVEGIELAKRLHLHAVRIMLPHPIKGKQKLDISAPLPDDLVKSWKTLGFETGYNDDPFEGV